MTPTVVDTAFAVLFLFRTFQSAVNALPRPKQDGFYSWLYSFLRGEEADLQSLIEKRFGITPPITVDITKTKTPDDPA